MATSLLWFLAVQIRRQPLWVHPTDLMILQAPLETAGVLSWPLLRAVLPALGWGAGLGVLVGVVCPQLVWFAVSLPLILAGARVLQAWRAAGTGAEAPRRWVARYAVALSPLLAAGSTGLLPVVTVLGLTWAVWGWHQSWAAGVSARARLDLEYEGLRQGARQLGLPVSVQHPDVPPRHTRIRPVLRGQGAAAAAAWRSWLHVLTHSWRLVAGLALGPALLPVFAAEPGSAGPVWSSLVLAVTLPLLGPVVPAGLPITGAAQRLARILPAALPLSVLAALGGTGTVVWAHASGLLPVVAALAPWVALVGAEWLDTSGLLLPDQAAQARFGVATLPGVLSALCLSFGLPWAAPVVLLVAIAGPLLRV